MLSEAYELFGCNTDELFIISVNTGDDNAACIQFEETYGILFPTISGVEGGGTAINNTYQIGAYPTYILIAPDHTIVEQDIWPVSSVQTFINVFESNGLSQAPCTVDLTADFMAEATSICEEDMVQFTDLSTGNITQWEWVFEGGTPSNSSEQNPVVTYETEGVYNVELTISDGSNSDFLRMVDYITVNQTPDVTLDEFEVACINWDAFELTGGLPEGGVYEGPGVEDGWFNPEAAGLGEHTITYTYEENGCEGMAEQLLTVDACTGIKGLQNDAIRIFPNPSKGTFELDSDISGEAVIKVYSLSGVEVWSKEMNIRNKAQLIDINELPNGFYTLVVQTENGIYKEKIQVIK